MQLFLAFIVALSVTAALIPMLAKWAPSFGLTDAPGPRKVHSAPVPRVGGLAMAAGLFFASILMADLNPALWGLLLGLLILVMFGLWDDRVTLGWRAKLLGQVMAVGICMAVGHIQVGTLSFGAFNLEPSITSTVITFFFLLGITNAINLADGLDGLAGGMALLCLCAIALFAMASGNRAVAAVALIEAGAVLGFLRFNTHPARVFMGDCGSQMLGLSVGGLALLATQGDGNVLSAALPLLLLGLPIVDTLTVMLTRISEGRSPFAADRNHVHHRLLALGFAHRDAVLLIYVLQVGLVLLAYFLRFELDSQILLAFITFAALLLGLLHWAARAGWRLRPSAQTAPTVWRAQQTGHIQSFALAIVAACVATYALAVLMVSNHVGMDLGLLSLGLLISLSLLVTCRASQALLWFERVCAYISVAVLVYMDQSNLHKPQMLSVLLWAVICISGVAALLRFTVDSTRRFELTTLDLIVIFIGVVLPNLPGSAALPENLTAGIAKALVLLYMVEMLLVVNFRGPVPRLIMGATLAFIACRAFLGLGT